jgi:hypothetical protein
MRSHLVWLLAAIVVLGATACDLLASRPAPPEPPEPPAASLSADGVDAVEGEVGSFSVGDLSSDSPWLPGAEVSLPPGAVVLVTLAGDLAPATWTAAYVPAARLDAPPIGLAEDSGSIEFEAPPPGRWSVQVSVQFEGGGSAAFYWDVLAEG